MKALKFVGKTVVGVVIGLIVVVLAVSACTATALKHEPEIKIGKNDTTETTKQSTEQTTAESSESIPKEWASAQGSAQSYSDMMSMSKEAIETQLRDFDKFPEEAAKYAVDNIDVDWNKNALSSAKSYQESMNMSNEAIHEQLINFDKFTKEQADYAVEHLEK